VDCLAVAESAASKCTTLSVASDVWSTSNEGLALWGYSEGKVMRSCNCGSSATTDRLPTSHSSLILSTYSLCDASISARSEDIWDEGTRRAGGVATGPPAGDPGTSWPDFGNAVTIEGKAALTGVEDKALTEGPDAAAVVVNAAEGTAALTCNLDKSQMHMWLSRDHATTWPLD